MRQSKLIIILLFLLLGVFSIFEFQRVLYLKKRHSPFQRNKIKGEPI